MCVCVCVCVCVFVCMGGLFKKHWLSWTVLSMIDYFVYHILIFSDFKLHTFFFKSENIIKIEILYILKKNWNSNIISMKIEESADGIKLEKKKEHHGTHDVLSNDNMF